MDRCLILDCTEITGVCPVLGNCQVWHNSSTLVSLGLSGRLISCWYWIKWKELACVQLFDIILLPCCLQTWAGVSLVVVAALSLKLRPPEQMWSDLKCTYLLFSCLYDAISVRNNSQLAWCSEQVSPTCLVPDNLSTFRSQQLKTRQS